MSEADGALEPAPAFIIGVALPPWGIEFKVEGGYVMHRGEKVTALRTHAEATCELVNGHCPIHFPSDHPLKDSPMILRLDKAALLERVCEHGIGHDDPDSAAYLAEKLGDWPAVHGCDGCCK